MSPKEEESIMKLRKRRVAEVEVRPQSKELLEDWLCNRARREELFEALEMGRASLFRYIKKIQNKEKTITELFSFDQIQKLIAMYNEDFEESKIKKEVSKDNSDSLEKQKKILEKTIKDENWDFSSTNFENNYAKQFNELIDGYNSPDEKIHQETLTKINELSKAKRTALFKYNNYLAIKRRKL